MNSKIYFLACAMLAANSFAAQPYAITAENLQAAKPRSLSLANVTATASGAKVVSYAASNAAVADFIKNLNAARAGKVDLLEIKAVIAMMVDGKEFRCAAEDAAKSVQIIQTLVAGGLEFFTATKQNPSSQTLKGFF
ncbi:hypothetical protein ACO0LC_01650 [Undibacterium sp. JH2W]|uniref:hypothetical protein n=1 Tax=Undibacterium sp. JH2W TaxID=3413037 RepID=UPI003BF4321D